MKERGELATYPGRVTDLTSFFDDIASRLAGEQVVLALDRYRKAEAMSAMDRAGIQWPVIWRGWAIVIRPMVLPMCGHFKKCV